jgi:hypothetical protein
VRAAERYLVGAWLTGQPSTLRVCNPSLKRLSSPNYSHPKSLRRFPQVCHGRTRSKEHYISEYRHSLFYGDTEAVNLSILAF